MKAVLRFLCVAVVALALVPAAFAGHTHVAAGSVWTLNVAASDFGGGPTMKSDVYVIVTDTEKWLKWTDTVVNADGKTMEVSWSGPQDGTMRPMVGMAGARASFTTANDSQHEEMADGTVIDAMFTLSADKKTVTYMQMVKSKDGKTFHQTLVYDRTK